MPTPKFKAGISGNPKGRPKDKTPATLLRKSIIDDMPDIILKLVEQAKNGDTAAAKILLDSYYIGTHTTGHRSAVDIGLS
jgi:hypothetical protein